MTKRLIKQQQLQKRGAGENETEEAMARWNVALIAAAQSLGVRFTAEQYVDPSTREIL